MCERPDAFPEQAIEETLYALSLSKLLSGLLKHTSPTVELEVHGSIIILAIKNKIIRDLLSCVPDNEWLGFTKHAFKPLLTCLLNHLFSSIIVVVVGVPALAWPLGDEMRACYPALS